MTMEELARFDQVLREADRIRREIALEEAFYGALEDSPTQQIYGMEYSREDMLLLAA